jgi:ribosomal protein S18 acetylase RimI-like enzyme
MTHADYTLGEVGSDDRNFVLRTWARAARMTVSGMGMDRERYYALQREGVIDVLLERGSRVFVARDADEPLFLYGFLVAELIGESVAVHFAYVKGRWRRDGIARDMLDHAVSELGATASDLLYTADARTLDERTVDGRRRLVPEKWLAPKLDELGFRYVPVTALLRKGAA